MVPMPAHGHRDFQDSECWKHTLVDSTIMGGDEKNLVFLNTFGTSHFKELRTLLNFIYIKTEGLK